MNYLILLTSMILATLAGCSSDSDENRSSDSSFSFSSRLTPNIDQDIKTLRDEGIQQQNLLLNEHKQELEAIRKDIEDKKSNLRAKQKNELAGFNSRKNQEIAALKAQGYDYNSFIGFSNPLKKPPEIVSNLIRKHNQEKKEINNRHNKENRDLYNYERTEMQNIHSRQNSEKDKQRKSAQEKVNNLIRSTLLNALSNEKVEQQVEPDKLIANPYIYEDQVVVIKSRFSSMLSKNEALFGGGSAFSGGLTEPFIVTKVPTTRFTEEKRLLLVARVDGNKEYLMPSGNKMQITHVEFIDAYDSEYRQEDLSWALNEVMSK